MKITLFSCLIVACLNTTIYLGANAQTTNRLGHVDESAIRRLLPQDYAAFQSTLTGQSGVLEAQAAIRLSSKARELAHHSFDSPQSQKDALDAYRATWRIALRLWQSSTDQEAKQLIFADWKNSLNSNGIPVVAQLYALSEIWDRSFIGEEFWRLLRDTKEKKIISSICYVLYTHGNSKDTEQLLKKRNATIEADVQEIIQNAINWMNYKQSGDSSNPGPAAAPPRIE